MKITNPSEMERHYLDAMGLEGLRNFELPDDMIATALAEVQRQHKKESAEEQSARAIARVACRLHGKQSAKPTSTVAPSIGIDYAAIGEVFAEKLRAALPSKRQIIVWGILVLLSLFLMAGSAFGQVDVIQFQNAAGGIVKTFGGPFKMKEGSNITFSASGSILTITAGAGGATAWDAITAPATTNLSLAHAAFTTTFTWNATTGAGVSLFTLRDTASNTGTGCILCVNTATGSAAFPVQFTAVGTANGVRMSTAGLLAAIGTGGINATQYKGGNASGTGSPTSCTNQVVTAFTLVDAAAPTSTCTTLTLASAQFANQGTTTTVLHGNAAGNPSWAGISLANDTTANQGTTTTVLHGNAAGQPSFGAVAKADAAATFVHTDQANTYSAGTQDFESAAVTRPFRRLVFASFPGTCTANREFLERSAPATAGQVIYVCNSGGTGWDLVGDGTGGGSNHNILSATHSDSLAASVVLGDIVHGNVTPAWARLAGNITTTKQFLSQTGTGAVSAVPAWAQPAFADLSGAATAGQVPNLESLNGTLDVASGGTGTGSTLTGLMRGSATAMTAAELSGAVTTSGSNATVLATKYLTWMKDVTIDAPVTGDSNKVQWYFGQAITITRVACSVGAATSITIQFDERAEATPNTAGTNVLTATLDCTTTSGTTTSFTNATIAARVPLNLQITAVTGTPGSARIHIEYTVD